VQVLLIDHCIFLEHLAPSIWLLGQVLFCDLYIIYIISDDNSREIQSVFAAALFLIIASIYLITGIISVNRRLA
jgi:hypothetical protein